MPNKLVAAEWFWRVKLGNKLNMRGDQKLYISWNGKLYMDLYRRKNGSESLGGCICRRWLVRSKVATDVHGFQRVMIGPVISILWVGSKLWGHKGAMKRNEWDERGHRVYPGMDGKVADGGGVYNILCWVFRFLVRSTKKVQRGCEFARSAWALVPIIVA